MRFTQMTGISQSCMDGNRPSSPLMAHDAEGACTAIGSLSELSEGKNQKPGSQGPIPQEQ